MARKTPPPKKESKTLAPKPIVEIVNFHPTKSKSRRWPFDALLRKHGFEIYRRPRNGNVQWMKRENREVYAEDEALSTIPVDDLADAALLDDLDMAMGD